MENNSVQISKYPRFTWFAGIGAMLVYLFSSLPFILIVAFFKLASTGNGSTTTDTQLQEILDEITVDPWVLVGALLVQCISLFVYAYVLSIVRGTKNPFNDFGLRFTKSSLWFLLVGVALQIVGVILSIPLQLIKGTTSEQGVVTTFKESSGLAFAALLILVAFVVPVAEELAFRGILQRGLAKYMRPLFSVAIAGSVFAAIHLADPGALFGTTSLFIVGISASALAAHRGRIDASICLHVGFNITTAFFFLLSRVV